MHRQGKILILDNEKSGNNLVSLLNKYFQNTFINVTNCPFQALEFLKENDYSLFWLNFEISPIDGIEVLKKVSQMEYIPKIVLMSLEKNFDFAQTGIEIGALGYIVKPYNENKIAQIIDKYKKLLNKKRLNKIMLQAHNGNRFIEYDKISFIKKVGRNRLEVQLWDGSQLYINGLLCKWNELLPNYFFNISRQCIINTKVIKMINSKSREIYITTQTKDFTLLCSRDRIKKLIELYQENKL